jgi:hypothetical protein
MVTEAPVAETKTERAIKSILAHLDNKKRCGFDFKAVETETPDVPKSRISQLGKRLRQNQWNVPDSLNAVTSAKKKPPRAKADAQQHEAALADVTSKQKLFSFEIGEIKETLNPNDIIAAYQHYLKLKTKYGFKWPFSDFMRSGARYYTALYVLTEEGINGDGESDSTGELGPGVAKQVSEGDSLTPI